MTKRTHKIPGIKQYVEAFLGLMLRGRGTFNGLTIEAKVPELLCSTVAGDLTVKGMNLPIKVSYGDIVNRFDRLSTTSFRHPAILRAIADRIVEFPGVTFRWKGRIDPFIRAVNDTVEITFPDAEVHIDAPGYPSMIEPYLTKITLKSDGTGDAFYEHRIYNGCDALEFV